MPARRLPVRPDLDHLRHQAKDLLRAIHRGEPEAMQDLQEFHPQPPEPAKAKLADAQLTLARSYEAASWPRLVICCNLIDAIWDDDVETVRALVLKHPNLLTENAGIRNNNWGPPLSYASNLGRDRIITHAPRARRDGPAVRNRPRGAPGTRRHGADAPSHDGLAAAAGGIVRQSGVHAQRRGHRVSVRDRRGAGRRDTANPMLRSTSCSRRTAASARRGTRFSRCTSSTAFRSRTRR